MYRRGDLILRLEKITLLKPVYVRGVEREFWRYDFRSRDGKCFTYAGKRYAIFIGKWYNVRSTFEEQKNRWGDRLIKKPVFSIIENEPLLL